MVRKPRGLPEEILQRVIALREAHSSWIKIQEEVKIDRRTAKRAYEDWQRSRSIEELKAARRSIAAEEFRNHLYYLVALAEALAQTVDLPSQPNLTTRAGDVLQKMWETNRLTNYSAYGVRDVRASVESRSLLLTSLKTHTSAKVRWDTLDEWEQAWDECGSVLKKIKQKTRGVVHNVLEQKQLLQKIERRNKKRDVEEQLVNGVFHAVWEQILRPYDPERFPILEMESRSGGQSRLLFGKDKLVVGIILDTDLCKQVAEAYKWAAKNALVLPDVEAVNHLIKVIQEKTAELRRSLNPLLLGPLIMNTRCDLCPA